MSCLCKHLRIKICHIRISYSYISGLNIEHFILCWNGIVKRKGVGRAKLVCQLRDNLTHDADQKFQYIT